MCLVSVVKTLSLQYFVKAALANECRDFGYNYGLLTGTLDVSLATPSSTVPSYQKDRRYVAFISR